MIHGTQHIIQKTERDGMIKMSEEPDVGDYEEYVLSGIEDQASEEVAQKYEEMQ